jgi:multiple antibiotic resistance protein
MIVVLDNIDIISNLFIHDLLKSIISLLVVVNPIGKVPLFITLTRNMKEEKKKLVTKNAIITTAILLTVFAIAGSELLTLFGINIFSFMIAGGVLLFVVSIELLTHGEWRFSRGGTNTGSASGESGIIPLAFPLLAGPGAITTVIISFEAFGLIVSIVSIIIVVIITHLVLLLENPLLKVLGRRGSLLITRVFAVFIAAIAIQYIIQGIRQLIVL